MFTLEYDGIEKSFADWGLTNIKRNVSNGGGDTFSFSQPREKIESAATFPVDSEIIVRMNRTLGEPETGVVWFIGRRKQNPRTGTPRSESVDYIFEGVWNSYLAQYVFQQVAKSWNNTTEALEDVFISRVFLCQKVDGTSQATGEQLTEIIQFAADSTEDEFGAPKFQPGTGFPAINAPIDEVQDITCAEAIQKMLRWSPDASFWIDYSTTPPTINCRGRGDLPAVNLNFADGEKHETIRITEREDLLVPCVHLKYQQTSQIDGQNRVATFVDIAPEGATGRERGAMVCTFDFQGVQQTHASASITTEVIDANHGTEATRLEWWKKRRPALASNSITDLKISGVNFERITELSNELISGSVADWLLVDDEPATVEKQKVTALASYKKHDRDASDPSKILVHEFKDVPIFWEYNATNAATGDYSSLTSSVSAEPLPVGLAQQLYDALSVLHYEGSFTIVEQEITDIAPVGTVVNIVGGDAVWATMRAQVQSVNYDLDEGRTMINFGPPKNLSAAELIELLRVNRNRFIRTSASVRTNASNPAGNIALGKKTPSDSGDRGDGTPKHLRLVDYEPDGTTAKDERITLATTDARVPDPATPGAFFGKDIKLRELRYCQDGEEWARLVLCSKAYKPDAPATEGTD